MDTKSAAARRDLNCPLLDGEVLSKVRYRRIADTFEILEGDSLRLLFDVDEGDTRDYLLARDDGANAWVLPASLPVSSTENCLRLFSCG